MSVQVFHGADGRAQSDRARGGGQACLRRVALLNACHTTWLLLYQPRKISAIPVFSGCPRG